MKKLMLTSIGLIFCNLSIAASPTFDIALTPDINGYYTVQMTGLDFGEGPTIALFDDFNNQVVGQPVDLEKALIGKWSKSSSYSAQPKVVEYDGGKAFQIHDFTKTGTAKIAQIEVIFPEKQSNIFISYSVVVPKGRFFAGSSKDLTFPDVSSWKFTWITDTPDGIGSTTMFNICAPTHAGKGSFLLAGNSVNHGWISVADAWRWHDKNYMSFGLLTNDLDPISGSGNVVFQLTGKKDASLITNKTSSPIFPASNTKSFDRVKFPGWFGNGDTSNFDAYYDDIYVAIGKNALARIELSDADDIERSTINMTMPVVSWTKDKIIFQIHEQNMNKLKAHYIRLYDRKNKSVTFRLPCDECPLPPTS